MPPCFNGLVTRDTLNSVMEFDHVIRVYADGSINEPRDMHAPNLYDGELHCGALAWSLMNGYSGQHGYSGPIMHSSEFIGGRMADDILTQPGVYVALVDMPSDDSDPDGWAVAFIDESE